MIIAQRSSFMWNSMGWLAPLSSTQASLCLRAGLGSAAAQETEKTSGTQRLQRLSLLLRVCWSDIETPTPPQGCSPLGGNCTLYGSLPKHCVRTCGKECKALWVESRDFKCSRTLSQQMRKKALMVRGDGWCSVCVLLMVSPHLRGCHGFRRLMLWVRDCFVSVCEWCVFSPVWQRMR